MLKSGLNFISSVTKLFNLILNPESLPELWNIAYQIPLFNVVMLSILMITWALALPVAEGGGGKSLNTRLQNKIESYRKLHDNQATYMADYSTTDQIFILKSLLNKYINIKKGRLYCDILASMG